MLLALTSLRFFAALMVFMSHLQLFATSSNDALRWVYRHVLSEGYAGVTFFFILSGFLLSLSYAERFSTGKVGAIEFWQARFARLYPLHLLTLLVALPAALLASGGALPFLGKLAVQLTLTQAFVPSGDVYFSFNYPAWSLSTAAFFYFLFPTLVRASTARLVVLFAGVLMIQLAAAYVGRGNHFLNYIFPGARLGDFVLGMLLFRLHHRCNTPSDVRAGLFQVLSVCSLAAFYAAAQWVPQPLRYDIYYVLPMGAVVLACSWKNGVVAQALSTKRLVLLGEASFALFLVHQLVIRAGEAVRPSLNATGEILLASGYVLLSIGLAIVLYRYVEVPGRISTYALLRRLSVQGTRTDANSELNSPRPQRLLK